MEENNNENNSGYTGEYGNSVEGGQAPQDSTYSYSYKNGESNATHSGDYYGGQQSTTDSQEFNTQQSAQQQSAADTTKQNQTTQQSTGYQPENNNSQPQFTQQNNFAGGSAGNTYQNGSNKKKKDFGMGKKLLICAACAVVFGVVAAICFEGVCYFSDRVLGVTTTTSSTKQLDKTTSTSGTVTSGSAVSGATDVSAVVEQTMPSIVAITSTSTTTDYYSLFGESQSQDTTSCGSGFIIGQNDTELLIATNNHVIDGAKTISVQFIDDQVYEASVKGTDSSNDLAVVAVKTKTIKDSTMDQIKIADLGDSDDLKVGEMAIAIGNALGYGQSVTVGYISAKDREITETSETDGSTNTIDAIQTDAAINPGNSGGPLINLQGQVVGINSAKISDSSVEGVGYAIPISVATPIIDDLKTKESLSDSEKGYLGISGRTVSDEASNYNIPNGVYVAEVSDGGAADKGGIKVGDIITSINNMSVTTIESLQEKANSYRKGTKVEITLQRSNNGTYEEVTLDVTLQGSSSLDGLSSGSSSDSSDSDSGNDSGSGDYSQGNDGSNGSSDGSSDGSFFSNPFGN